MYIDSSVELEILLKKGSIDEFLLHFGVERGHPDCDQLSPLRESGNVSKGRIICPLSMCYNSFITQLNAREYIVKICSHLSLPLHSFLLQRKAYGSMTGWSSAA